MEVTPTRHFAMASSIIVVMPARAAALRHAGIGLVARALLGRLAAAQDLPLPAVAQQYVVHHA